MTDSPWDLGKVPSGLQLPHRSDGNDSTHKLLLLFISPNTTHVINETLA